MYTREEAVENSRYYPPPGFSGYGVQGREMSYISCLCQFYQGLILYDVHRTPERVCEQAVRMLRPDGVEIIEHVSVDIKGKGSLNSHVCIARLRMS